MDRWLVITQVIKLKNVTFISQGRSRLPCLGNVLKYIYPTLIQPSLPVLASTKQYHNLPHLRDYFMLLYWIKYKMTV